MSNEYLALRHEVIGRLRLLHQLLAVASAFLLGIIFLAFGLYVLTNDIFLVEIFLLFTPIVFSCLTFNYQANQMTMEAVSCYLRDHSADKAVAAGWENHYAGVKRGVELISFLKILPLLLPQLVPIIILLGCRGWQGSSLAQILIFIDLALLLLVIFNFRYKYKK